MAEHNRVNGVRLILLHGCEDTAQRLICIMHIQRGIARAYALFLGQLLRYEFVRWIIDLVTSDSLDRARHALANSNNSDECRVDRQ
jgi:hypothetical protein